MKRLIIAFVGIFFICSCSGIGYEEVINVPGQNVSFVTPPIGWEKLYFTTTSQLPTGETIPTKVFIAAWRKGNYSAIGVSGYKVLSREKKVSSEKALRFGLVKEVHNKRKLTGYDVNYTITNENSGILREGIIFTSLEADIYFSTRSNQKLRVKTVLYDLEYMDYKFAIQFEALETDYKNDLVVFQQMLDSFSFIEP